MSAAIGDRPHIPVLLAEVIAALAPVDGGLYIDGTFGAGGYSSAILAAATCRVIGIDRDPQAQARGKELAAYSDGRFQMVPGCFADMDQLVGDAPAGIVLDIGVSSMQLDQAERGFSFQADGPLDMRMEGAGSAGQSAADVVNSASETELADIIYYFGEERLSRRIARALVAARITTPIERTTQLAEIVARAVPRREPGRHPATKTFQALRIHVNDELGQLARGLAAAERLLPEGARLVVVTFHSLEDRVVKRFFAGDEADAAPASRHLPMQRKGPAQPAFNPVFRGHRSAGPVELAANPRARSAKLRAGIRTSAAPRNLAALDLGLPELVRIAA